MRFSMQYTSGWRQSVHKRPERPCAAGSSLCQSAERVQAHRKALLPSMTSTLSTARRAVHTSLNSQSYTDMQLSDRQGLTCDDVCMQCEEATTGLDGLWREGS